MREGQSVNTHDVDYFSSMHQVKMDLFKRFGVIAAAGDRHLAEFMPLDYLVDPDTVEKWGFKLTPVSWRIENDHKLLEERRLKIKGEMPIALEASDEVGVNILIALAGIKPFVTNANYPNKGQAPDRFARLGLKVTGIDLSRGSLTYAKSTAQKEALDIDYIEQNYLKFQTEETYDLITMIYCDYCALSDSQRADLLKVFKGMMTKESRIFIDVHTKVLYKSFQEGMSFKYQPQGGFWREKPYYEFLSRFKYDDITLEKYNVYTDDETLEIYNWLKCFNREAIEQELGKHGLMIESFYSDVAGRAYEESSDTMALVIKFMEVTND